MEKSQKIETVQSLKAEFENVTSVFVVHYQGLSVKDLTGLRRNLRNSGRIVVAKKTLAKIAVAGTHCEDLSKHFKGPIALLFSNDPVDSAKMLTEFQKNNEKLQIVAGFVNNKAVNSNEIQVLAKLPSMDELRGQIVSIISRPATNLVNVLGSSARSIVRVIDEYSKKGI